MFFCSTYTIASYQVGWSENWEADAQIVIAGVNK